MIMHENCVLPLEVYFMRVTCRSHEDRDANAKLPGEGALRVSAQPGGKACCQQCEWILNHTLRHVEVLFASKSKGAFFCTLSQGTECDSISDQNGRSISELLVGRIQISFSLQGLPQSLGISIQDQCRNAKGLAFITGSVRVM